LTPNYNKTLDRLKEHRNHARTHPIREVATKRKTSKQNKTLRLDDHESTALKKSSELSPTQQK
jgi:hypothetical protein